MARGHHPSPPASNSLPKVEFEVIVDEKSKIPAGHWGKQAISFGYNPRTYFRKPEHYIRHTDPLESDLAKTVEYDMDEQDEAWMDAINTERKKGGFDPVSPEAFEVIMDRLEKEWFDLTKNIPKPEFAMPSEDSTCAICDDSEGENSNAIVFCDGCNLAVHQDCYGVPYIPEGQWLCRKCTVSPENPVSCYLCPNEGGAFKQTTHGEWVHLLCAIWIPETRVANDVFMEPVTGVERISKQRWKLRCSICEAREGACIQCTKPSCFVAFHATCARKEKLLMPMKSAQGAEPASLTCFCDKHLPPEQQEARAAALEGEEKHDRAGQNTSKAARAYAKTYKPGPPLVPAIIVNRILLYTKRISIRKKQDFVQQMCRYWSLKREARRGAPLLKRLHLEPWTSSAGAKVLTEEEKKMRLDQLKRLRQDLINVRGLTDLCRKREIRKQRQMEVIYEVLAQGLFPAHQAIRDAFENVQGLDKDDFFKNPVSKNDVPDYYEIVKNPMCWTVIDAKLDQHQYWNLDEFRHDLELVSDNALLYNQPKTEFHSTAKKTKKETRLVLEALESIKYHHDPSSWAHMPPELKHEGELVEGSSIPPIGDLESPVNVLELLMSSDPIKDDLNMEIDTDPVTSLLNYEFARVKPPPLHPPTPPPAPLARVRKVKVKRDRKAEAERSKANKEAREAAEAAERAALPQVDKAEDVEAEEHERLRRSLSREEDRELQTALDASAGFRAPRTRGARAIAAAFEAEVQGTSSTSISVPPSHPSEPEPLSENSKVETLKKRPSIISISQPSTPMLVDHVDNRDSFNMFNAGWILPSDQKRGGRVSTDRQPLPPPRKRQKTDHGSSRLSIVSTAPSEGYAARNTAPLSSGPPEMKYNPDHSDMMDVDDHRGEGPSRSHHPEASSISRAGSFLGDDEVDGPLNVVTQPNGVVIIEKLDTPAIRRERNMRRKAEKRRQAALGIDGISISAGSSNLSAAKPPEIQPEDSTSTAVPPPPVIPPSPSPIPHAEDSKELDLEDDLESELSELSDDSDASEFNDGPPAPIPAPAPPPPIFKGRKPGRTKKPPKVEQFEDGTIVWAKSESYPWWPAVVHADTSPEVPGNILQVHKEKRMKRKIKLYIVQYYDKQASWQSVARDKLQLLGEDKKIDGEMLSSNPKQKWKTSASKQQCREAYEMALAAMDMDGDTAHHIKTQPGSGGDTSNAGG